ncbi:MFS transporter, FHS family, L-fucose permease [Capronia coronata CBS 617.96]|uniref:MFS transporter, FHS family, L-fucose permease n=1 Tax=Capronia coronata CBS 617.96 TaxID=1182541 RepID=W9ZNG4_9EURO|nr:MFS transporter, FHS family, L-fucose permease [Capronia coronata CBS 617.96]EXJ96019.1 MFS transporter, FHS family, L-fucose permease [Capronia coronata CBS 617.96]
MPLYKRKVTVSDGEITNAAHLTLRQSLLPNCLVTILFFLWGFAYGLLDVLNSHFQTTLNITASRSSGLQAAYFGAYFLCPLTISGWILRRFGFRVTFMTGLAVLTVGCLLFWPSGVKKSFGGFCGSMFVVGMGLSTLETAADPFLAICGPPRYSEIRLNLAQAVQGVGSFVAPLLASRVFFAHTVDTDQGLKNVQWTYLGVACFVALLIILFILAPFPEITDADMQNQEHVIAEYNPGPLRKQYTLFLGVWCQFCYVGAQVAVAGYFINFVKETGRSAAKASDLLAAAQGIYAANRFIAGFLLMIPAVKPRYMLIGYLGMCCVLALVAALTRGTTSVAFLMLVFIFESSCFANIFTLALRGLGRHTKRGGSWLVAAISGGTVWPSMTGAVVTAHNAHMAMLIPMTGYIVGMVFPIYINLIQRERMDMHRATTVGIVAANEKEVELERNPSLADKPQAVEIQEADLK